MAYAGLRMAPQSLSTEDLRRLPKSTGNVDRFGRRIDYLRISITDRCNLRCVYCMPPEGVALAPKDALLTPDEVVRLAAAAYALGFCKFRVTGGEPLVVRHVLTFLQALRRATPHALLALTTNGVHLAEMAGDLRRAGVQRLNISLDTLRPERFLRLTRRDDLAAVLQGIEAALCEGFERVKINAVIVRGVNDDELLDLAALAQRWPVDVRFIEQMPLDGQVDGGFLGAHDIVATLATAYTDLHPVQPDDARAAAQQVFASSRLRGQVAVIAPRSSKFCGSCNRLRLTPHGELKGCLLSEGTLDVRGPLRAGVDDIALGDLLRYAIGIKPLEYSDGAYGLDRPMSAIGG